MGNRKSALHGFNLLGVASLVLAALAGCGEDGKTGPAGPTGASAPAAGTVVGVATMTTEEQRTLTFSQADTKITGVTVSSPPVVRFTVKDSKGRGVTGLGFTSKSSTATVAGLTNMAFAIAKLVPDTASRPSRWVSYVVTTVPTYKKAQPDPGNDTSTNAATPTRPTTDNTGTLVDNGDGSYTYTFYRNIPGIKDEVAGLSAGTSNKADLDDLTYDPALTHRVTIQIGGSVRGTGSNTSDGATVLPSVPMQNPINLFYDFIPATGQVVSSSDETREIVNTSSCMECHTRFTWHGGDALDGTPGSRQNTHYCVVCHTDQRKYGRSNTEPDAAGAFAAGASTYRINSEGYATDATTGNKWAQSSGLLVKMVHRIHRGEHLFRTGYNYAGVLFNEVTFPQDIRYCQKCHNGQPDSNNFKNKPNRAACGACHDYINFDTGANLKDATKPHSVETDDTNCAGCHTPTVIESKHVPFEDPNLANSINTPGGNSNTNAAWVAGFLDKLPTGAIKVTYDLKSFTINSGSQPVWVFRMLQDDVRADFNTPPSPPAATGEIWNNFAGAPSVYAVFAVPQDGNTSPADFNVSVSGYLRNIWRGTATSGTGAGTMTGPDASGYYTVTLTGVTIPANAKMVTGGLGFSYSLSSTPPLTQTNLTAFPYPDPNQGSKAGTGGLIVPPHVVWKLADNKDASGNAVYSARRDIVENARCVKCHAQLGVTPSFHAGERNDPKTCAWCHRPNQTSSGWTADSTNYIHAIHSAAKRTTPYTWHAASTTESYADITFPGILRECQTCHLTGTYDFSATASAAAEPNRLFRTVGQGIYNAPAGNVITPYYSGTSCTSGSNTATALGVYSLSPYITPLVNYGLGFSYNAGLASTNLCNPGTGPVALAAGTSREADSTTLVISPTTAVCFACHDSSVAQAHFKLNGGVLYGSRASVPKSSGGALLNMEQCLLCHGPGKVAAIADMHKP